MWQSVKDMNKQTGTENTLDPQNMQESETTTFQEENTENQDATTDSNLELEKLRTEAADWKDKYIRLYAEFENFRQRTSKEKLALIGTATEGLMTELLPVIDDFERSLKAMEQATDVASLKEGVELVFHKLVKTLNNKGLKPMESIGKPFDADSHEAITQIPAPDPSQKGLVLDEVEKGYQLQDKTIRYAKVVIGA